MGKFIDMDQLLIIRIHSSCLILSLTTFDKSPTLITVAGPDKTCILFNEREEDPLIYQDLDHYQNLDSIWNFLFQNIYIYQ